MYITSSETVMQTRTQTQIKNIYIYIYIYIENVCVWYNILYIYKCPIPYI